MHRLPTSFHGGNRCEELTEQELHIRVEPEIELLRFHKLQIVQFPVQSVLGEKFLMGAGFLDLSLMHDNDLVGMLDRGKSVCNHDRSSALHEFCQSTCDKSLGLRVDIGSCLV